MTSAIPCTSPLQPLHHFSCAPLDTLTVLYLYYTESICAVRKAAELGSVGIKFSRLELRRINFAQVSVLVPKEMPTQQHNVPQTKNGLGKPSRIGQCCVDVPAVLQSVFSTAFLLSVFYRAELFQQQLFWGQFSYTWTERFPLGMALKMETFWSVDCPLSSKLTLSVGRNPKVNYDVWLLLECNNAFKNNNINNNQNNNCCFEAKITELQRK